MLLEEAMNKPRALPSFNPPDKRLRPSAPKAFAARPRSKVARAADPAISSLLAAVDQARLAKTVKSLANFPTRHSLSPHNVEAARWLRDQFKAIGYRDVTLHDFTIEGQKRHNVVCTKKGSTNPGKYVLVGAHYDSRMSDLSDSSANAPGADDNGSGSAALLELAHVFKTVDMPCSIQLVAFSGEEQGLLGSTAYVGAVHAQGLDLRLMLNLDMIGHLDDARHRVIIVERDLGNAESANDAPSQAAADEMASTALEFTSLKPKLGPIYDSDYMPFEHFGYVCIGVFDGAGNQPFYHSTTDTPDKVDAGFHAEVVRMVVATVFRIASH
jgi:Zn-dependent M28 family amino/carboxypeptidase